MEPTGETYNRHILTHQLSKFAMITIHKVKIAEIRNSEIYNLTYSAMKTTKIDQLTIQILKKLLLAPVLIGQLKVVQLRLSIRDISRTHIERSSKTSNLKYLNKPITQNMFQ